MGKKENAIIRRIVVTHLDTRDHRDKLYLLDDVATLFGLAVNCSGDITKIVRAAFAELAGGKGGYTYNVPLEDMELSSESILYSMRSRPTPTSPWNVVVGCFAKETLEELKEEEEVIVPNRINIGLHKDAIDELVAALEKKSNGKTSSAADDVEVLERALEVLERNKILEKELERVKAKLEELEGAASLDGTLEENESIQKRPYSPSNEQGTQPKRPNRNGDQMDVESSASVEVTYLIGGEGGMVKVNEHSSLSLIDFKANISREHLTFEDIQMDEKQKKRATTYSFSRVNGVDIPTPNGVTPMMNNKISELRNKAKKIKDLMDLFNGKQMKLPRWMMRRIVAFRVFHAMPDAAVSLMFFLCFSMINNYLQLGLTNEQIANGTPSESTLANYETKTAAECQMAVFEEMKNVKYFALGQDAGNKGTKTKNLEHLIKVIHYPVFDEKGNVVAYGRFCLDVDVTGKTGIEVAQAIITTIKQFQEHVDGKNSFCHIFRVLYATA